MNKQEDTGNTEACKRRGMKRMKRLRGRVRRKGSLARVHKQNEENEEGWFGEGSAQNQREEE